MSKTIQTFLGPATIRSESFAKRKARIFLHFHGARGLPCEQRLIANRIGPAAEPNTWRWQVGGISTLPSQEIIAPNSRAAVQNYLKQRPDYLGYADSLQGKA